MEIKINIINEMKKLRNCTYSDKYSWISEIIQNCQRAKATKVEVTVGPDKIVVSDNGVGCTDPNALFEKNVSGWDYDTTVAENPFGEGFFSTLVAANHINIKSVGFEATFDVNKMFENNDIDCVDIKKINKSSGFIITLTKLMGDIYAYRVIEEFKAVAKYIKCPAIYVNGEKVKYEGTNPNTTKPFVHKIDNEYFRGWIRPYSWNNDDWDTAKIKCFAFDRLIKESTKYSGVFGIINFKSGAVNLRSPDRKEFIFDTKYDLACKALEKEIHKMYMKVVREGTDRQIKSFENFIDKYTDVQDYKKYIKFKFLSDMGDKEDNISRVKSAEEVEMEKDNEIDTNSITNINDEAIDNYCAHDLAIISKLVSEFLVTDTETKKFGDKNKQTGEFIDGRSAYGFYVNTDEINSHMELIELAQYYHIPVIEVRNCLERNIIKVNSRFKHIADLSSSIKMECKYNNTKLKTDYEVRVIKLLNAVMKAIDINIPDMFVMCDASMNKVCEINGRNKIIETVEALATAYEGKIYLNRKYLYAYKNLNNDSTNITNEDIRFLMLNLETIAHELSHVIYNTEDNTKEHMICINRFMQKIINAVYGYKNKPICI